MSIDVRDEAMHAIVDENATCDTVASDLQFTEGPIWHPGGQHLTFSDIPANKLYRWDAGNGLTVYREPSQMANGNTYDHEGRILSCEHAASRVTRDDSGTLSVLASHYEGKELNSPNDIIVSADGDIYFTDPAYGRRGVHGVEREQELSFQGVYHLSPTDLTLTLLTGDLLTPNGLCLGLDPSQLFVADTQNQEIRRYTLAGDGLTGGDVFAQSPAPDGLKIDAVGNLYAGGPGGVHVYDGINGGLLGVIQTPGFCANFTWGGDEMMTLFMTASTAVFSVPVRVPGTPLLGQD